MFLLALRLRAKNISIDEAERQILKQYPGTAPSDKYMRSRTKRLFLAPGDAFVNAVSVYESGGHINDILAVVPAITCAGAPRGNLNARGKRQKSPSPTTARVVAITLARREA